ncbi:MULTISPECIES: hypothetical protein, partial [unclassified Marinobacter]
TGVRNHRNVTLIDELSKTIRAQLHERVSSPLLATFSIAWLVWNYKFVLILFASVSLQEKFQMIDAVAFPSGILILLNGLVYPLAAALVLIFLYPIPAKYVYEYAKKRQRDLKEIQQKIDDETPLTKEEARAIRKEALKRTMDLEEELEKQVANVERLKEIVREFEESESKEYNRTQSGEFSVKRNPRASDSNLNRSNILVTAEKYVEESIKNHIIEKYSGADAKFLVDVKDNQLHVSVLPGSVEGQSKSFRYDYETPDDDNLSPVISDLQKRLDQDVRSFIGM